MDDIYHEPKYKPGDVVVYKRPSLYPEIQHFIYHYGVVLSANSDEYRMLDLEVGSGAPKYIVRYYSYGFDDSYPSKLLYHIDADKIRDLCCEGPQI